MKISSAIIFTFMTFTACSTNVKINDIISHPRDYVDKEVNISGKVTDLFSLGFVSYFELDDGSGVIKIITSNPLPAKGEIINVRGTVQYYTLVSSSLLVIKENSKSDK